MPSWRRILVIVNLDASTHPNIDRARRIAETTGARLHLHAIAYDPALDHGLFDWGEDEHVAGRRAQLDQTRQQLEELAAAQNTSDATVSVSWDHPFHEAVNAAIEAHDADLLLIQPRQPGSVRLSTAEWRLLRDCAIPVWIARVPAWPDRARLVAAVDPMDELQQIDRAILENTQTAAAAIGAEPSILHALGDPPGIVEIAQTADDYQRELAGIAGQRIRDLLPPGFDPEIEFAQGNAAEALLRMSASGVTMVALGVLARSRLADLLIGSTAREFIPHTRCDLLLLRITPDSD